MSNLFNCQDIQRDVFHKILATFVKAISAANRFLKDFLALKTSLFLSCFLFSLPLYFRVPEVFINDQLRHDSMHKHMDTHS